MRPLFRCSVLHLLPCTLTTTMATSTLLSYNFHHPFRQNPRVNHVATVIPKFSSPKSISLTLSHTFKHSTLKEAFQSLMSLSLTYPFSFQFSHHDAFSVVLDLWGSEKAVLQGQQVHALLVKTCGLCDSMFLGTKLVHMYGKCGFFSDTQKVFDRMPDRTVFTWNAMLGACVSSGKHVKALELFTEMRVKGVDTPGAYADLKSEELGQGEAIAHNLRTMFGLKVPIVTVVTGEGGSGGALAIACANKLFMLENSAFYVASPEACAAILWKSSKASPKAAEKLRITAQDHYRLGIADGIIPEPLGGAHSDPNWTSQQIKLTITQAMEELTRMNEEELLHHRHLKFRSIGQFQEGLPVEPKRKRNMKPSEVNLSSVTDIETELRSLRKQILESKGPTDPMTNESIQKLVKEVDDEITKAIISMGLAEKVQSVKLELFKNPNQHLSTSVEEKVDKIMEEINIKMAQPGAYLGLKQKLQKLDTINSLIEMKVKQEKLRKELNERLSDDTKAKIASLIDAQERMPDHELAEKAMEVQKELEKVLKSANLEIVGVMNKNVETPPADIKMKIIELNNEINGEIDRVVNAEEGLKDQIKELENMIAQGMDSKDVEKMEAGIKDRILAALDAAGVKEKIERMKEEVESLSMAGSEDKIGVENGRC